MNDLATDTRQTLHLCYSVVI